MTHFITIRKVLQWAFLFQLFLSFTGCSLNAQENAAWPSFHGPDRTNKSPETGLLGEWPEEGPPLLWTITGLGKGYSTVSIADGYIFTAGIDEQQTFVFAFDLDGNLVWKKPNGRVLGNRDALGHLL